ncbi:caffeic acid 3-O-methyltransferase [Fagus crenata]
MIASQLPIKNPEAPEFLEIIVEVRPGACLSPSEIASQLLIKNPDVHLSPSEIASLFLARCSILTYSLRRLLVPDGRIERLYNAGPVCKFLTKNQDEDGVSIAPLCLINQDKVLMGA